MSSLHAAFLLLGFLLGMFTFFRGFIFAVDWMCLGFLGAVELLVEDMKL